VSIDIAYPKLQLLANTCDARASWVSECHWMISFCEYSIDFKSLEIVGKKHLHCNFKDED